MSLSGSRVLVLLVCGGAGACALVRAPESRPPSASEADRFAAIVRSQIWTRTNVQAMNLRTGPGGSGAFAPGATVSCTYVEKKLTGKSPKFLCRVGARDEVMVKFGPRNGEVYGEVLATRLLWALGFGADRMYPVKVICKGCPSTFGRSVRSAGSGRSRTARRGAGTDAGAETRAKTVVQARADERDEERAETEVQIDPAAIERRMAGAELTFEDEAGWSWDELDWADPEYGGAPRAHRDALKLLAVFLQHGDNKRDQQRILCRDARPLGAPASCRRPFLMISDLGLTFGRSNRLNANDEGSVSLTDWQRTPIWKHDVGCTGNLRKSFTGSLADPVISEEGRRFLAGLLVQLTDRQLRDLFTIARVTLRRDSPEDDGASLDTIGAWVETFRQKRREIVERRCA